MLETGQFKILVDCGLDYEKDRNVQTNENFPFDPAKIDVVILTHAHIDHSGAICPRLSVWDLKGRYYVPLLPQI